MHSCIFPTIDNVELTSTKTRQFTCPEDLVIFTCRVFRSSSLEWRSPLFTQTTSYLATDTPPRILNRGPLTISLINVSGTTLNANFTSTLRVTASRTITRTETTVTCLSGTAESETDNFTVAGEWIIVIKHLYMYLVCKCTHGIPKQIIFVCVLLL